MTGSTSMDWLAKWNLYSPSKLAIEDIGTGISYTSSDFFKISNGIASYLKCLDINFGDRVAVLSTNKVEMVFLYFALQRLGATLVPINFRFASQEVDYVLNDCGAKILFYSSDLKDTLGGVKSHVTQIDIQSLSEKLDSFKNESEVIPFSGAWDKPCQILYTSGTTGFPKGVVITPKILFWNSVNTSISLNLCNNDSMVSFLPLFHTGGWNVLLTPFIHRGATTYFIEKFDATRVLKICSDKKITVLFGVPTTLSMMAKTPEFLEEDLSSLKFTVVGGEPMPLSQIQAWHKKGVSIRQGFGLTECGPNCFSLSEKDAETKIGSIGRPNFYVETRIVNENNQDVSTGEVGELLLRGPMCMTEYWQKPEATQESFFDGWLRTGDLVSKDKDEYFYVVGRKKEMFISGGENVYPVEVEKVLSQHPEIDEVAVLGVKDEKWGEVGKAFVVLKKDQVLAPEALIDFCLPRIAKYKIPRQFEFLGSLPKGSTGKILKKELIKETRL